MRPLERHERPLGATPEYLVLHSLHSPPKGFDMRRNRGFTAIELMVVIAIVAILAALALPSFDQMIKRWQMRQTLNALTDTIYLARSEAVKWGGNIRVRKIPSCPGTTQEWGCGWQIDFVTPPSPLPTGVTNPIRIIKANEKTDAMASPVALSLNQWGNPDAGFSVNVQHVRDTSMESCLTLSSGGRVQTVDTSCP